MAIHRQANSISDPNLIVAGRRLTLPVGTGRSRGTVRSPGPCAADRLQTSGSRWSPAVTAGGRRHPSALAGSRLRLMPVFEYWAAPLRHAIGPAQGDLLPRIRLAVRSAVSSTGAVGIGQLMPDDRDVRATAHRPAAGSAGTLMTTFT